MYNDNNIKKIVKLLTKRNRPIENIIWRANKIGIKKEEVINSMNLLLDLGVVGSEFVNSGDGWNSRSRSTKFFLK